MLLDAVMAQKIKNVVVDRADNETYCCGSCRKLNMLMWIAQKINILLWIAQKMKNIAVNRAENYNYCG